MEISKDLEQYLFERINNLYYILDVSYIDGINYRVEFIQKNQYDLNPPTFQINQVKMDLKSQIRNQKITDLLSSDTSDFDVEDILYTPEQQKRLKLLRQNKSNSYIILNRIKNDYSNSFSIGDKVYYKGQPGIVTFKHISKKNNQNSRWSILIKDTEYRYVDGCDLLIRVVKDLQIKIDKELDKLSTERLLKMYKRSMSTNKGRGNSAIKAILNQREHVKMSERKIIIVG